MTTSRMLVSRCSLRATRSAWDSAQSTNALTVAVPSSRASMWNVRGATLSRFRMAPTRPSKSGSASATMLNVAAPSCRGLLHAVTQALIVCVYISRHCRPGRSFAAIHRLRDRLGCLEDTQNIPAREPGDVSVTPSTAHQFGEQLGISRYVTQPGGQVFPYAVEVRADADMIDARNLRDVLDMIGDHRERDAGLRMLALPNSQRSRRALRLPDDRALRMAVR